jgi:LPS export ABC transporter protein LptC
MKLKIILFLLFFASVKFAFAANAATPAGQPSDQQISGFSLAGYEDKGKKSWDIAGKSAEIFNDVVQLQEVSGNLYGKEQNVNLTSKTGNFNKDNGKVHLEKDVVITTSEGAKLTTNSMDWDRKNELVTTDERVNIEKGNMNITAVGARGEPSLKKVSLAKDVQLDINPATTPEQAAQMDLKEKITVTCDGQLTVDYEKNIATFTDNVKVEKPDIIIYSDVMDLYFTPKKKDSGDEGKADEAQKAVVEGENVSEEKPAKEGKEPDIMGNSSIERIVARGNVKIIRGENTSFSQEAVYNAIDKKIVLTGRPKLVFYTTEDLKNASLGN